MSISSGLGISERTVNFHIYNVMKKLGPVNRFQMPADALRRLIRLGWTRPTRFN